VKTLNDNFDLIVFCDGGSRGNPGQAAYGFVIFSKGRLLAKKGERIGIATNNVAEYKAVYEALNWISNNSFSNQRILINADSKLVVMQLSGSFKIKNTALKQIAASIKNTEKILNSTIVYRHIPRLDNMQADTLVNIALDQS
jgi:ribonuclease HI